MSSCTMILYLYDYGMVSGEVVRDESLMFDVCGW